MPLTDLFATAQQPSSRFFRYLVSGIALCSLAACSLHGSSVHSSSPQAADPKAMQWQQQEASTLPTARHENGFVAVGDRLYLLGGRGERPLDVFDPAEGTWSQGAQPPFEVHHMQALAYDDKLYVLGAMTGGFPEEPPLTHILIYDPATDAWSQGPEIPEHRRRGGSGVVEHEGLIYLIGGNTRGHMSGFVSWLDVFDPQTGRWQELPDAPHARDHSTRPSSTARFTPPVGARHPTIQ